MLVVDDDDDSREALAMLLRWAGFEVYSASNGADALSMATEIRPRTVILDIGMPDLDGYAVCRLMRKLPPFHEAHIYALSGYSGAHHEALCIEAGFTSQFTKPLDAGIFTALISAAQRAGAN